MASMIEAIGARIGSAASEGEAAVKRVFREIMTRPEVRALSPRSASVMAYAPGRAEGGASVGGSGYAPAMPGSAYGPGRLAGLLGAALKAGKTIAGTQPYAVTSYFGLASAGTVAKNVDIADMFASVNTPAFTVDDTFPWPFQAYRMRWTYTSVIGLITTTAAGTAANVADPAWIATLHAVFSNATEIARVALNNLGLRTSLIGGKGFIGTTLAQGFGVEIEEQPGVAWPVYYEKNGSYVMSVRSDHSATAFSPFEISSQLDGWVINDPNLVGADESQIQNTLDTLMRNFGYGGSNSISISSKMS